MLKKYNDITEDLFKIYLSIIDVNKIKVFQNINDKYTIIDKTILASYIYIKALKDYEIEYKNASSILINNLLKPIIFSETGNICIEVNEYNTSELIEKVINNLTREKLEYKNRLLKYIKIEFEKNSSDKDDEYQKLWDICEIISEIFILLELYLTGNEYAYEKLNEKIKKGVLVCNNIRIYSDDFNNYLNNLKKLLNKNENNKSALIIDLKNNDNISELYNLLQVPFRLKGVMRYSQVQFIVEEDVLIHTYIDTIINLLICNYLINQGEKIDKTQLVIKCLFHDFGEYKGNEIISEIKLYNNDTKKIFENIEEKDEEDLKELIGEDFFNIVKSYKKDCTGYISDIVDKIAGVMKVYIEVEFHGNYNVLKSIKALYKERIEKFNNLDRIKTLNDKNFFKNLIDYVFMYIKGNLLNKYKNTILTNYYTREELLNFKKEIEEWKLDLEKRCKY